MPTNPDKNKQRTLAENTLKWPERFKIGLMPMHDQHDYHRPYEIIASKCGTCRMPLHPYWCDEGLLRGPYVLLGTVLFHEKCADDYLRSLEQKY